MKESFFNRTFFWWGIYYGIAAVLIFLIEYFVFPTLLSNSFASTIISIFPLVLFMTLAGNAEKKKQSYNLNIGVFNESFANGFLTKNGNVQLGVATLGVVSHDDHSDLQMTLRWNRVWGQFKQDVLGLDESAAQSDKFKSYFGDVYAKLQEELKPIVDRVREERTKVQQDISGSFYLLLDYYKYYLPQAWQDKLQAVVAARQQAKLEEEKLIKDLPMYKRVFFKYNKLADKLKDLHVRVRKYSKRLARFVPRLPKVAYNNEVQLNKMAPLYDNNLIVTRPTYNSFTLYQFNAEYRERLRGLAQSLLRTKGNLLRNTNGYSLKALYNKYKLRPLREYTMVGHVYNRRNVLSFNGELKALRTKCRYLLAHELSKNQFSVILNNNDQQGIISVSAYGQAPIDISATGAFVNGKSVSLPYRVEIAGKNAQVNVRKTHNGVVLELNQDLQVACYEDTKSCTVATTRFYTGKVNGLLGKSNQDLANVEEDYWYLESSCKATNQVLKKPSDEAVKTCYGIFGKHRRAHFRDAFLVVRPNGWQRLCENALTVDSSAKCPLMRAFVTHARIRSVDVNEPNECFECSANSKKFNINKNVKSLSNEIVSKGVDYAFVFLPCEKSAFKEETLNVFKKMASANAQNRYYFVKVGQNGASVYQSQDGKNSNFDLKEALNSMTESKSGEVHKTHFYNGLFLAANLFSNRVAQERKLIIISCGNCLSYTPLASIKLAKLLNGRNIRVSSYSTYDIKDLDSNENVVGYGNDNVFLYNEEENLVETDNLDSYKVEHQGDLCQRLAAKTDGYTFSLEYVNKAGVFEQVVAKQQESAPSFAHSVNKCVRLDTPFGDFEDFSYEQREVDQD